MQEMYDTLREEDRRCTEALRAAQKRFEAISMGKFDDGSGEADTLQQQLMKLKSEISTASTTIKTAEMKMKHDSQELKRAESELKKYEKDNSKDTENLQTYEKAVQKATND